MYTFHVTLERPDVEDAVSLHRLVRQYQLAVSSLGGMDIVPARWLHLTVQGVGFTDEVDDRAVRAILAAARGRCAEVAPFELTLGPALLFREGISLCGRPLEPARRLRTSLRAAIADVWGQNGLPESEHFIPHVSLAYSATDGSTDRFIDAIEACPLKSATITVRGVTLIVLNRDSRMYQWHRFEHLSLGVVKDNQSTASS